MLNEFSSFVWLLVIYNEINAFAYRLRKYSSWKQIGRNHCTFNKNDFKLQEAACFFLKLLMKYFG